MDQGGLFYNFLNTRHLCFTAWPQQIIFEYILNGNKNSAHLVLTMQMMHKESYDAMNNYSRAYAYQAMVGGILWLQYE